MDHHMPGVVDDLTPAIKDVRGPDLITGASNAAVAAVEHVDSWVVMT
jgi:hypothetical protein